MARSVHITHKHSIQWYLKTPPKAICLHEANTGIALHFWQGDCTATWVGSWQSEVLHGKGFLWNCFYIFYRIIGVIFQREMIFYNFEYHFHLNNKWHFFTVQKKNICTCVDGLYVSRICLGLSVGIFWRTKLLNLGCFMTASKYSGEINNHSTLHQYIRIPIDVLSSSWCLRKMVTVLPLEMFCLYPRS